MSYKHNKYNKPPLPKYFIALYAVFISIFIFSAYKLINYYYNNYKAEKIVDHLTEKMNSSYKITDNMLTPKTHGSGNLSSSTPILPSASTHKPGDTEKESEVPYGILTPYKELYQENKDLAGWITIDNTNINYPVMYRKDDNKTYLNTDFKGNGNSLSGCIFIDGRSNFLEEKASSNLIIYGHNMKIGTMFHDVDSYKDEAYYLAHPVIHFDTLYKYGTYEIMAAFPFDVEVTDDSPGFRYYDYYNVTSKEDFNKYLDGITNLSLYNTGIKAEWGDELITLSTCSGNDINTTKRFVIVARKKNKTS